PDAARAQPAPPAPVAEPPAGAPPAAPIAAAPIAAPPLPAAAVPEPAKAPAKEPAKEPEKTPARKTPMIGIDLGTTNSAAAVVKDGKPFVIPSREGYNTIPSIVALNEKGKLIVGHPAKSQLLINP